MRQPAKARTVANARIAREIEELSESVRRHPELHHDSADRLLALARRIRKQDATARTKTQRAKKRTGTRAATH